MPFRIFPHAPHLKKIITTLFVSLSLFSFIHLNFGLAPSVSSKDKYTEDLSISESRILTDVNTVKVVFVKVYQFITLAND